MSLSGLNSAFRLGAAMMLAGALAVSGWAQDSTQSTPPPSSATSQSTPVQAPQPQQFHLENFDQPRGVFSKPNRSLHVSDSASAQPEQHSAN